jgi:hypothetical protein
MPPLVLESLSLATGPVALPTTAAGRLPPGDLIISALVLDSVGTRALRIPPGHGCTNALRERAGRLPRRLGFRPDTPPLRPACHSAWRSAGVKVAQLARLQPRPGDAVIDGLPSDSDGAPRPRPGAATAAEDGPPAGRPRHAPRRPRVHLGRGDIHPPRRAHADDSRLYIKAGLVHQRHRGASRSTGSP